MYCKVRGGIVSIGGDNWLLKWVDYINCRIIMCDGNDCSGVVIGVSG